MPEQTDQQKFNPDQEAERLATIMDYTLSIDSAISGLSWVSTAEMLDAHNKLRAIRFMLCGAAMRMAR